MKKMEMWKFVAYLRLASDPEWLNHMGSEEGVYYSGFFLFHVTKIQLK